MDASYINLSVRLEIDMVFGLNFARKKKPGGGSWSYWRMEMSKTNKVKRQYVVTDPYGKSRTTVAVSPEKAINNARYKDYLETGAWYDVPDFDEYEVDEIV